MSTTDTPIWVLAMLALSGDEYRVWSYVRWRQGQHSEAWPSLARMAQDLRLTVNGVRRITRRLATAGWLRIEAKQTGRGHCLRYSVTSPQGAERVTDGLPFTEGEKVTHELPLPTERVTLEAPKGSPAGYPNTIKGTLSNSDLDQDLVLITLKGCRQILHPTGNSQHAGIANRVRWAVTRGEATCKDLIRLAGEAVNRATGDVGPIPYWYRSVANLGYAATPKARKEPYRDRQSQRLGDILRGMTA